MVGIRRDEVPHPVTVTLLTDGFPDDPVFDAAVSRALLERAAAGEIGPVFRLSVPGRSVQFGRMDAARPGFGAAVEEGRALGFAPVVRLAGGRAAVFHEGTLSFARIVPEARRDLDIERRFAEVSGLMRDAFASLGADARIGEVPGEYCPGRHSVNLAGSVKVMGIGQRLVRGASHVGGVVVVADAALVNLVLDPVYRHLGYEWDPAATGALADAVPTDTDAVAAAIVAALRVRHDVAPGAVDPATLEAAERIAARGR